MRKFYLLLLMTAVLCSVKAQNVGIGTIIPSPNAILHLENGAADLGLLLPNVTTAGFTPLASDEGLMVYDPGLNQIFSWDGSAWQPAGGTISLQSAYDGGQLVNMGTGNIDFQTSAANPLLYLDEANERIGIGTAAPGEKLDIVGGNINIDASHAYLQNGNHILSQNPGNASFFAGQNSGQSITTGTSNTLVGLNAGSSLQTGSENTALGEFAFGTNITGSQNTAIGTGSQIQTNGSFNTTLGAFTINLAGNTGQRNTAVGASAMRLSPAGDENTAVGMLSIQDINGNLNTGLGYRSGLALLSGDNNTFIGANADAGITPLTNATAIGADAIVSQDNSLVLGNNANVGIGTSTPANKLEVIGDAAKFDSIIVVNNAQAGYVLTAADASGAASWQPAGGGSSWDLLGNTGTNDAVNFLGTTDGQDLVFRTNNFQRMRIDVAGRAGFNIIPLVANQFSIATSTSDQGLGVNNSRASASSNTGIRGDASNSTSVNNGIFGNAFGAGSTARGVYGTAGTATTATGVEGAVAGAGVTTAFGVRGSATSTGTDNYGVYGQASGGTNNYAGFFQGNMITTGNIGAGNSSPNAPLQFATALANRKIVLFEGANNDHQYFGFGVNAAALRYQVNGTFASHIFYASVNTTTSNELMRIVGDGNVGIGVSAPTERLQISSSAVSTSMIITNDAIGLTNTDGLLIGENNAGVGIINNRENERLLIGTNGNIGQMLLDQSGNVGIGQATPLHRLDVLGAIRSGGNGLDGQMRIFSEQGATDYEVIFNPNPAMTTTTTYTLPADDGAASDVLTTDGAGGLSWATGTGFTVAGNGLSSSGNTVELGGTVTLGETRFNSINDLLFRIESSNAGLNTKAGLKLRMFDSSVQDQWEVIARKSDGTANSGQSNFVINKQFSTAGGQLDAITIDGDNSNVIINNDKTTALPYGDFLVLNGEVGIGTNAPGTNKLSVITQSTNGSAGYFENNIASGIDGSALRVLNSGTRSIGHNGALIQNLVTKVGGSNSTKRGLRIESTGAWGVATVNQPNIGLDVTVSGADNNYAAIFNGGNVGIGTSSPTNNLEVNGTLRSTGKSQINGTYFITTASTSPPVDNEIPVSSGAMANVVFYTACASPTFAAVLYISPVGLVEIMSEAGNGGNNVTGSGTNTLTLNDVCGQNIDYVFTVVGGIATISYPTGPFTTAKWVVTPI